MSLRKALHFDTASENRHPFGMRDTVRLVNRNGEIPAGTIGDVLGWFVPDLTYVVNFPDQEARIAEVHPDEIVLVDG
jgi:hypothetical protein